jgi:small subunit ribosomal protein S16
MAVKIRLTRMGKKKQPTYRVVVVDSRKPRDGAYIEQIGRYDPRQDPSLIEIDNERAIDWLRKGAQPTDRARKLLEISGAWTRFRVAKGDIHTVDATPEPEPVVLDDLPPPPEEQADEGADAAATPVETAVAAATDAADTAEGAAAETADTAETVEEQA